MPRHFNPWQRLPHSGHSTARNGAQTCCRYFDACVTSNEYRSSLKPKSRSWCSAIRSNDLTSCRLWLALNVSDATIGASVVLPTPWPLLALLRMPSRAAVWLLLDRPAPRPGQPAPANCHLPHYLLERLALEDGQALAPRLRRYRSALATGPALPGLQPAPESVQVIRRLRCTSAMSEVAEEIVQSFSLYESDVCPEHAAPNPHAKYTRATLRRKGRPIRYAVG
jgi:hypothetical protein